MSELLGRLAAPPAAPLYHRFASDLGEHVLIVRHSRIFDLPADTAALFDAGGADADALADVLGASVDGDMPLEAVVAPTPQSISLNVSSSCNLTCSYCFAGRGSFAGKQTGRMSWPVARAAIDRLFMEADPAAPVTIGFLGGEPFLARDLVHQCVEYAADAASTRSLDVRFSVTTNGTLLRADDVEMLRRHRFAVTISVDGGRDVQNTQRPAANGADGFALLRAAAEDLLRRPGRARLSARATVTRHRFDLERRFDSILELGFPEVGFSPHRVAGDDADAFRAVDWPAYQAELVRLGRRELAAALRGERIRFSNLAVALAQLHRGASSPYPCGAGGGYFSVSAAGRWYACHRAIGAAEFDLGDSDGLDAASRARFLRERHVHADRTCATCWARYLCSGSCHQEARARSDASCGFIRGWLDFCLAAYCELVDARPDYFDPTSPHDGALEEVSR
jgi:uncharacterized protein